MPSGKLSSETKRRRTRSMKPKRVLSLQEKENIRWLIGELRASSDPYTGFRLNESTVRDAEGSLQLMFDRIEEVERNG